MYYTLSQWLLIFFTYCFLGWVWECCYVSICRKELVNRGFLYGCGLPVYGFGAIIILWLTLPFEESIPLIYISGSLGASILEYVTGVAMEKIFHMRYWDYSHHKFNLNGHISLFISLGWGIFSVLLVKILHPLIKELILQTPYYVADAISLILTITFVVDVTISIQSTLDMKKLLKQLTENNKIISSLQLKINEVTSDINQTSDEFQKHIQEIKAYINVNIRSYQFKIKTQDESKKTFILEKLQNRRDMKSNLLELLNEKTDTTIKEIQLKVDLSSSELEIVQLSKILRNLNEFKAELKKIELNIASIKDKEYKVATNIIRRNPSLVSKHFKEALEEIKTLTKSKR
ncbi:MAG: hypothetical protein PHY91_01190 [Tissierellia bacterium]|nr:hypothetical protein [Tissierellia bacterium]MDD4727042.1 hypothetical protein [Tissierellia bacterium]